MLTIGRDSKAIILYYTHRTIQTKQYSFCSWQESLFSISPICQILACILLARILCFLDATKTATHKPTKHLILYDPLNFNCKTCLSHEPELFEAVFYSMSCTCFLSIWYSGSIYLLIWTSYSRVMLLYSVLQEIQLDELLTHEVRLEDIHKAFEQMKQPDCVKVLIKLCDWS